MPTVMMSVSRQERRGQDQGAGRREGGGVCHRTALPAYASECVRSLKACDHLSRRVVGLDVVGLDGSVSNNCFCEITLLICTQLILFVELHTLAVSKLV